jgi:methylated-DNA-[protein]-cysteine S-methyltransferase
VTTAIVSTPIGPLTLSASRKGLARLAFALEGTASGPRGVPSSPEAEAILAEAASQLDEYFSGRRQAFDLPIDLAGTPFQQQVWQAIARIPYGETASYAAMAAAAGRPLAYRAAGTACGANQVAIIIPCHRVVGSDRGLHGFGGGLDVKRWLLDHEARHTRAAPGSRVPVSSAAGGPLDLEVARA